MENKLILEQNQISRNKLPNISPTNCLILRKKNGSFQIINFGEVLPISHQILFPYNYYYLIEIGRKRYDLQVVLPALEENLNFDFSLHITYQIVKPLEFLKQFIINTDLTAMNSYIEHILVPKLKNLSSSLKIIDYKKLENLIFEYINTELIKCLNVCGIEVSIEAINVYVSHNIELFIEYKRNLIDFQIKVPSAVKHCDFNVEMQNYIILKDYSLFSEFIYEPKSIENRIRNIVVNYISSFSQNYNIVNKNELKNAIITNLCDHDFEYDGFETKGNPIFLKGIYFDESTEELIRGKIVKDMDYFCNSNLNINSSTLMYRFGIEINFTYTPTKEFPIEYKKDELNKKLLNRLENLIKSICQRIPITDRELLQKELDSFIIRMKQEQIENCIIKEIHYSIEMDEPAQNFISRHVFANRNYNYHFQHIISLQNNIGNYIIDFDVCYKIIQKKSDEYLEKEFINKAIINMITHELNKLDGFYLGTQKNEINSRIENIIQSEHLKNQLYSQNILLENIGYHTILDNIALEHISNEEITKKKIALFAQFKDYFRKDSLSDLEILKLMDDTTQALNIQSVANNRKESAIKLNMEILEKFGDKLTNTNLNNMFESLINKQDKTFGIDDKNNDTLHLEKKENIINGDLEE